MSSTTTSIIGSSTTSPASAVTAGKGISRRLFTSRTATLTSRRSPTACSRRRRYPATPVPTVPQPISPTHTTSFAAIPTCLSLYLMRSPLVRRRIPQELPRRRQLGRETIKTSRGTNLAGRKFTKNSQGRRPTRPHPRCKNIERRLPPGSRISETRAPEPRRHWRRSLRPAQDSSSERFWTLPPKMRGIYRPLTCVIRIFGVPVTARRRIRRAATSTVHVPSTLRTADQPRESAVPPTKTPTGLPPA